jgi:pyruvate dehydrogenase E2 component (dihydrolipoamide acetyltransferase)
MRRDFQMPDIGEGIAEVEIIEWRIGLGDQIQPDQIVATIQTDKSVVEMPTPLGGTVVFLGAEAGDLLAVGSVLIAVETEGEVTAEAPPGADLDSASSPAHTSEALLGARDAVVEPTRRDGELSSIRVKAAPSVRRLAAERGVNLAAIRATGPGGRVTRDDVLDAGAGPTTGLPADSGAQDEPARTSAARRPAVPSASGEDDEHVPLRGLRRQIAKKMVESWRTVPHIIDYREVDASLLIEVRQAFREARPEYSGVLTYLPLFVKISAIALRRHPLMNASFNEEASEYVLHGRIHIGIATATSDGLLVPVVRDADRKSTLELAVELGELVELARTRKASLEQLTGGTYTVNNLGSIGASMGTPIIRTPEVGITGFGRITDRVVARDGVPVVRPIMMLSSVGDHRLLDGDTLGSFTATLVQLLENPYELLTELV